MIERPILGRLTQGCIFTCAAAENYPACPVHGFVITARCDVEQEKSSVLNYLPIVAFEAWLQMDGFELLFGRLMADAEGALRTAMEDARIPEALLLSQTPQKIVDTILGGSPDKAVKKAAERFLEISDRKLRLERLRLEDRASELFEINPKTSSKLIKELIGQQLSGYYFLPNVAPAGNEDGYVILLREVKHLGWELGRLVANGLDSRDSAPHVRRSELSFTHSGFAEPIGELRSPHVEHVMQCFSSLFGRIGLPDPPKAYVEKMCARRPASAEDRQDETR